MPELIKENVKVNVMGYQEFLPSHTQDAVKRAIEQTKDNTGMVLNFALNYGARAELLTAMKQIAAEVSEKTYTADEITEETIADHLMTGFLPTELRDPELLIRTSGEERISNFLLWQIAYSELFFTKALWPDFSGDTLETAIASFQNRNRRFGGLKETTVNRRERSAVRQRVITAIVALIIFIPIIWYGGFAIEIAAVALAVVWRVSSYSVLKGFNVIKF